jgi:chorismate lyase
LFNAIPVDRLWCARPLAAGALQPWLMDGGSLTARLTRVFGPISVMVLNQGLRRPHADERFLWGPAQPPVLVREVVLSSQGQALIFAHTVVALHHQRGAWRGLVNLGHRPLGAALFADPKITRHSLRYKALRTNHPLWSGAARQYAPVMPTVIWARRSIFGLAGAPILVSEVFLPSVLARLGAK